MSELTAGAVFAGYRIEAPVARGGMGVVYRAIDARLERAVALKVIAPHLFQDPVARRRFLHESRAAAAIEHPNVIPIHAAGEEGDTAYIVMRFVEGFDLQQVLRHTGALEPGRAARIVAQIAAGLDAAHARGLVHRDVKPANILIDRNDHAYLTDFGLAQAMRTTTGTTRSGEWVGTADYVAPEQIRGERVDARADVYSLGCVLFHALTGEVPFERGRQEATLWAHLSEPPPSARDRDDRVSAALSDVARRGMAKRREDRFPSAGDLGGAAVEAAAGRRWDRARERFVGTGAAGTERAGEETQVARAPVRRRRPVLPVLATAAVAVVATTLAVLALRPSAPPAHQTQPPAATPRPRTKPARRVTRIPVGLRPAGIASAGGAIWVLGSASGRLVRIPLAGGRPRDAGRVARNGRDLDASGRSLYAAFGLPTASVVRLDARTGARRAASAGLGGAVRRVDAGPGAVWVGTRGATTGADGLLRLDPRDLHTVWQTPMPHGVHDVATGGGAVWVAARDFPEIDRVDPATGTIVHRIPTSAAPLELAYAGGVLWATMADDTVVRIEVKRPARGTVTFPVPGRPGGIAASSRDVWVAAFAESQLVHIDARHRRHPGKPIDVGLNPSFIVLAGGAVWAICAGDGTVSRVAQAAQ